MFFKYYKQRIAAQRAGLSIQPTNFGNTPGSIAIREVVSLIKNRYLFYLIIILSGALLLFIPARNVFNYYRLDDSTLEEAFRVSGAEVVETNINVYSSQQGMFLNGEEVASIAKSLAYEMEVDFETSEKIENYSDDYNQISVIGQNLLGYTAVIIVNSMDFSNVEESDGGSETDIVLDVSIGGHYESLAVIEKVVERAVNKFIKGARVTSCIIGRYENEVPDRDRDGIIASVLDSADATEVERSVYDGMLSISAYTSKIGEHVEMGRNKINLNVAMRYNSYEDRTYIWLGSPIISVEY